MKTAKTTIGLLIIILIAIPTLFATIWAVGFAQAVLSPELLSDLPQEIIDQVPDMIDEVYHSIEQKDELYNKNVDVWLKAMTKVKIPPKQLMQDIGLNKWLKEELSVSFKSLGQVLRSEKMPRNVTLNLRPLKKSLSHQALEDYYYEIVAQLPDCSPEEIESWKSYSLNQEPFEELPPCKPDHETAQALYREFQRELDREIPDDVYLLESDWFSPWDSDLSRQVVSFTYTIFLVPAVFILLGSIIGATSKSSFFKWSGVSTLIGGISALALSSMFTDIVTKLAHWNPYYYYDISSELQEILLEKAGGIIDLITTQLFAPVTKVAGVVCVIGIILFAISFVVGNGQERQEPAPRSSQPAAPQSQSSPPQEGQK